jgi:hypothetical protein
MYPILTLIQESVSEAERYARGGLKRVVDAYNFLEDDVKLESFTHQCAHNIAAFAGGAFGCIFEYDDGVYYDSCALSMMHHRWGNSMGFTAVRRCSICHQDIDECPHLLGHQYEIEIVIRDGICNACGAEDCEHKSGDLVQRYPTALIEDVDLFEVSYVRRPRDPLARPSAIELDIDLLTAALRRKPTGEHVCCYRCLDPCNGFYDPFEEDGVSDPATPYSQGFITRQKFDSIKAHKG